MISDASRYADSQLVTVLNRRTGKNVVVVTPSRAKTFTFNYVNYVLTGNDRVDILSHAFYNDALQWWKIADANPERLDWTFLTAGELIRVPNA